MYASVADLRAEGVASDMASDARLVLALTEASAVIDRVTGWFFEPRELRLCLDGRGTLVVEPPVPAIQVGRLTVCGAEVDAEDFEVEGAPVAPWFVAPSLRMKHGRVFPRVAGGVVAEGLWGYTEADGTATGRTPLAVRRAAMLLSLSLVPKLGEGDGGAEVRNRWRILSEGTRDQNYRLAPLEGDGEPLTGDAEVDRLLARYRRPGGLGAA